VLPALVRDAVDDLLERVDRALPGRVDGFYVVGSVSLGAFRSQRSDVDFVSNLSELSDAQRSDRYVRTMALAALTACERESVAGVAELREALAT
jgi:hypothetical protein